MLHLRERNGSRVVVEATGKLTEADYHRLVPQLEHAMELGGKLRMMVRLLDFKGWTVGALIEDLGFDLQHRNDMEKIAVVGERRLEAFGVALSKALFSGELRYFEDEASALAWLDADA
ncbi:MAG: STAS/SEC14 domain-containing protein [Myxococcota bacterium]|nr:STAS/SEC14 domain-containing protein [Myxococcota bacterium]